MTLYRRHRGSLAASMETVCEIADFAALVEVLRADREVFPDQSEVVPEVVVVKPYFFDLGSGWDTHLVTVAAIPVGFTDGPLEKPGK